MNDRTLVIVMTNGIGAHLTSDEKRAHLSRVTKPTRAAIESAWHGEYRWYFVERDQAMTTAELAKHFTSLLKKNDHEGAAKYNANNIVSYEAMDGPMALCSGKDAVQRRAFGGAKITRSTVALWRDLT
jgi:hypothetical protein